MRGLLSSARSAQLSGWSVNDGPTLHRPACLSWPRPLGICTTREGWLAARGGRINAPPRAVAQAVHRARVGRAAPAHGRIAVKCMSTLLCALPHFNYTSDLLQALVPCMAHGDAQTRCGANGREGGQACGKPMHAGAGGCHVGAWLQGSKAERLVCRCVSCLTASLEQTPQRCPHICFAESWPVMPSNL